MPTNNWLPLNEYSAKYKISLSTLRRRIRGDEVNYKFEGGKYLLHDKPISKHLKVTEFADVEPPLSSVSPTATTSQPVIAAASTNQEVTNTLMAELKKAYVAVLHEKEEQIIVLKEEIVDLNTLVKMLEIENENLKRIKSSEAPSAAHDLSELDMISQNNIWLNENLER